MINCNKTSNKQGNLITFLHSFFTNIIFKNVNYHHFSYYYHFEYTYIWFRDIQQIRI